MDCGGSGRSNYWEVPCDVKITQKEEEKYEYLVFLKKKKKFVTSPGTLAPYCCGSVAEEKLGFLFYI